MDSIATAVAYFTSAFILLPAGRDVISYETAILPGEDVTRPLMTATSENARTLMWGIWGLNHCALSILKCMAVYNMDKTLLQFLAVTAAITFGYLVMEKGSFEAAGGDLNGFIVICFFQTASLAYLAFATKTKTGKKKK